MPPKQIKILNKNQLELAQRRLANKEKNKSPEISESDLLDMARTWADAEKAEVSSTKSNSSPKKGKNLPESEITIFNDLVKELKKDNYFITFNNADLNLILKNLIDVKDKFRPVTDEQIIVFMHILQHPKLKIKLATDSIFVRYEEIILKIINILGWEEKKIRIDIATKTVDFDFQTETSKMLNLSSKNKVEGVSECYNFIANCSAVKKVAKEELSQYKEEFVKKISKVNILALKNRLIGLDKKDGDLARFLMHDVRWVATHATDAAQIIQKESWLGSTKSIGASFGGMLLSGKSSNVNKDQFGNEGFAFFRVTAGYGEMEETRYGTSTIVFDLKSLEKNSWLSMHDQAYPFARENTRELKTKSGELIRKITDIGNDGTALRWGVQYYSNSESLQTETAKNIVRNVKFTDEIFFDDNIIASIVLTIVNELRQIREATGDKVCSEFIANFDEIKSSPQCKKDKFAANLLKLFVRPELKVPLGVDLKSIPPVLIHNPIGIGVYDINGRLKQEVKDIHQEIKDIDFNLRNSIGKLKDNNEIREKYQEFLTQLTEKYKIIITKYLTKYSNEDQFGAIIRIKKIIEKFKSIAIEHGIILNDNVSLPDFSKEMIVDLSNKLQENIKKYQDLLTNPGILNEDVIKNIYIMIETYRVFIPYLDKDNISSFNEFEESFFNKQTSEHNSEYNELTCSSYDPHTSHFNQIKGSFGSFGSFSSSCFPPSARACSPILSMGISETNTPIEISTNITNYKAAVAVVVIYERETERYYSFAVQELHKKNELLLGRIKAPGGNVDSTDSSVEYAAIRELKEETGLDISALPDGVQLKGFVSMQNRPSLIEDITKKIGFVEVRLVVENISGFLKKFSPAGKSNDRSELELCGGKYFLLSEKDLSESHIDISNINIITRTLCERLEYINKIIAKVNQLLKVPSHAEKIKIIMNDYNLVDVKDLINKKQEEIVSFLNKLSLTLSGKSQVEYKDNNQEIFKQAIQKFKALNDEPGSTFNEILYFINSASVASPDITPSVSPEHGRRNSKLTTA